MKWNNFQTLCGVVVYHFAIETKTRHQAKWAKTTTYMWTIHNDPKWLITFKTNLQKIHSNPKQAKTSFPLLGKSGKINFNISPLLFYSRSEGWSVCSCFAKKTLTKQMGNRQNLFFFFSQLFAHSHRRCMHFSICVNEIIEFAKIEYR